MRSTPPSCGVFLCSPEVRLRGAFDVYSFHMKRLLLLSTLAIVGLATVAASVRYYDLHRTMAVAIIEGNPDLQALNSREFRVQQVLIPAQFIQHEYSPVLIGAWYYFLLLMGIVAAATYDVLDHAEPSAPISIREVLSKAMTPGTYQGMLVSPIVFGFLRASITMANFTLAMSILAFQNGFFWRSTFQRIRRSQTTEATPAPLPKS
jgi:hypothetical protein